jgi:hypothetical protein
VTQIGRQFVWPNAAGTPTDPGVGFAVVGAGPVYDIELENELVLYISCTGGAPIAVGVMAEVLLDGVNWSPWCVEIAHSSGIAATDALGMEMHLPQRCQVRFSVMRYGGTANSLVTVRAWGRQCLSSPSYLDGPLSLANHLDTGIICWGNGTGGHDHPAAGPAYAPAPAGAGAQLIIPTGVADTLVITYTVAALAATTIEFVVQESLDQGTTFYPRQAVNNITAGVVNQTAALEQVNGALGTYSTREITVIPGTLIRIDAQRTGGGAGTELTAVARLFRLGR